ncbi:TetR/AcrR family transcriptional regulator [Bradyrhizobium stylosanthis]|uniref:TetR family transcriptional regulator n=1 Tax=Bradyrhizobium stylosanthis TaxID=1803665 RepID=A0A560DNZ9_9BRAD|nr:TetR/AcrR family transcriptional regulator [Bradyrhizobium stylosanthis]TWA98841.1 TetR family transcriptional regulator [Bradyrhizobium stylosanthis]
MRTKEKRAAEDTKQPPVRRRDKERTRREILEIAFAEFAENGLAGGNTDAIAARANVTKRLIFYYFNTKEELFTAVLEMAYAKMRIAEQDLHLEALEPEAAIRRLAEFTFDFDQANPEYVRLVTIENIHRGRHIRASKKLKEMTRPIVSQIAAVLDRGVGAGVIRPGIDPVELHMSLNALCFFSVANRHTFEAQFAADMSSQKARAQRRVEIADLLWRYVRNDQRAAKSAASKS